MTEWAQVLEAGPALLVQDSGRSGYAAVGVSMSGAADRRSFTQANAAVGNNAGSAALEFLLGGLALAITARCVVAVTGLHAPVTVDGSHTEQYMTPCVLDLHPGDVLQVGAALYGLRGYVAVRGGLLADPVLGSVSTDTLSGLGPAPLSAGSTLARGPQPSNPWLPLLRQQPMTWRPNPVEILPVHLGPRAGILGRQTLHRFFGQDYILSPESNRIGVRLCGCRGAVPHTVAELPSEAMLRGAIQLPPAGHPVVFGPDHPVTGGYPVVGVVDPPAADLLMQMSPGQRARFKPIPR